MLIFTTILGLAAIGLILFDTAWTNARPSGPLARPETARPETVRPETAAKDALGVPRGGASRPHDIRTVAGTRGSDRILPAGTGELVVEMVAPGAPPPSPAMARLPVIEAFDADVDQIEVRYDPLDPMPRLAVADTLGGVELRVDGRAVALIPGVAAAKSVRLRLVEDRAAA